jgi:hypothetical protein
MQKRKRCKFASPVRNVLIIMNNKKTITNTISITIIKDMHIQFLTVIVYSYIFLHAYLPNDDLVEATRGW